MKNEKQIIEDYTMKLQPRTPTIDTHNNADDQPNKMQSHFFASCALGWATASTRDEAIKKLAQYNYSDFKYSVDSIRKKGEIGTYIWTCEVMVNEDTEYKIEFYAPANVPKANINDSKNKILRNRLKIYKTTKFC